MLSRGECFSPAAIESDEDKHETLGVEGSPAEEERENNNNWKFRLSFVQIILRKHTQHSDDSPFPLGQISEDEQILLNK